MHPLRLYALIEAGIAVCALLVLYGLPLVERVYFAGAGHGFANMLMRSLLAAICLLPPTMLMGASLPAAARWIESTPRGASWWGLLYGTNTLGAVFGCLLAGFYLLRIYNIALTTYAAAIDQSCGGGRELCGWRRARRSTRRRRSRRPTPRGRWKKTARASGRSTSRSPYRERRPWARRWCGPG